MASRWERARRPHRSEVAQRCHRLIRKSGHDSFPLRLCWPTYLVIRSGQSPVLVQVLRYREQRIDEPTLVALRAFVTAGLEAYTYDPQQGFTRLKMDKYGLSLIRARKDREDQGLGGQRGVRVEEGQDGY